MRRSEADALRSLKRYVALMLDGSYEVRLSSEDGQFRRPFALVEAADAGNYTEGTNWIAEVVQPFAIYVYPTDDGVATGEDAVLGVVDASERIYQGFRVGVGDGRPLRVPFYDYDGIPLEERAVRRGRSDFMRVTDISVNRAVDPENKTLWTIAVDLRLAWARIAEAVPGGRVVESVTVEP